MTRLITLVFEIEDGHDPQYLIDGAKAYCWGDAITDRNNLKHKLYNAKISINRAVDEVRLIRQNLEGYRDGNKT